jgi:putative ABC transport system ATP-binding protein
MPLEESWRYPANHSGFPEQDGRDGWLSRLRPGRHAEIMAFGHRSARCAPVVRAVKIVKRYGSGDTGVVALRRVSVDLGQGQFTAIMGPSGSGKSTLMHCLAGLDVPDQGEVFIAGTRLAALRDRALTELRRDKVGFVFQGFNLIPTLNARDNILLPMAIGGAAAQPRWFDQVIAAVGLADRLDHYPAQLSGGQQQRVACARALLARPEVVFADEPTGNLDSRSGTELLTLLRDSVRGFGQTIAMVTHDPSAACFADRVIFLSDGQIASELLDPTVDRVLDAMRRLEAPQPTADVACGPVVSRPVGASAPVTSVPEG